jgi:Zn-dependent protease
MTSSIKLGHIWDIPIGLHASWFLIFGVLTWSFASGFFPAEYPNLPTLAYWLLAVATSVLFFGSVFLHELGHTYVAVRNQIPVRGITLFLFGGVALLAHEPRTPGAEFRIAIAGPLVSLGLAITFGGSWFLDQHLPYLAAPSMWLARTNFVLAVFNMIPGFPLDGGRVLRALIWKLSGSLHRATQTASVTGQLAAFGFLMWGALIILNGNFFNGLWIMLIGWFLQNAAAASYTQTNMSQSLRDMKVAQVMTHDYPTAPGNIVLQQLVEEQVLTRARRTFFISDNGHPRGVLTLREVAAVPRENWQHITAEQAMTPWERVVQVQLDMDLFSALQTMDEANVAQAPVVKGEKIVGMLSREQILHYIRVRAELGI